MTTSRKGNIVEALPNCVQHFAHCDCPAQETIQLQMTVEGTLFKEMQQFLSVGDKKKEALQKIKDSILQVKVEDMRRMYEITEVLHSYLMDYLAIYSRQMACLPSSDPTLDEAEIWASFESVMPRKSLLYWMESSEKVKILQLDELADIVHGIRVFNKCTGKGGATLELPHEQFKIESESLGKKLDDALKNVNKRVEGLTKGILLYIQEYGIQHIFIQRLRDDLAYAHQTKVYLQNLSAFVSERDNTVLEYHERSTKCIDKILDFVEDRTCIPGELVFPVLQKVGIYNKCIAEDYNLLQGHLEVANVLLDLIWHPHYIQSPVTARRLEIKAKNFLFLPRGVSTKECPLDSIVEQGGPPSFLINEEGAFQELQDKLQYGGYCPVNLVRYEGVLIQGDPAVGIVRLEDRFFVFADQNALNRFAQAPQSFIEGVRDIVLRLPHLIHILGIQTSVAYSFLSIPQILHTVPDAFPREFGIQTYTHALPKHTWDEETLLKRLEDLKHMKTHTAQTCMETSHFHRDSISQVWPPKDKWTQTGVPRSTCMPRYVCMLHNLRGEIHQDFKVVKSSYEWPT
ncbi:unnamed protein product [Calypogeia fissa]